MLETLLEWWSVLGVVAGILFCIYFVWSIYNKYLETKILKKRRNKLAELEEMIEIDEFASKLEKKIENRTKAKKRFNHTS